MKFPLCCVDAFSAVPFRGNPVAFVLLEARLPEVMMRQIAFENGLAETAFLVAAAD